MTPGELANVAIHESAHAFEAHWHGWEVGFASIVPAPASLGRVWVRDFEPSAPGGLRVLLAGDVAVELVQEGLLPGPVGPPGSWWREFSTGGLPDPLPAVARVPGVEYGGDAAAVARVPAGDQEAVRFVLRTLLPGRWSRVLRIAEALLRRGTLEEVELQELLER